MLYLNVLLTKCRANKWELKLAQTKIPLVTQACRKGARRMLTYAMLNCHSKNATLVSKKQTDHQSKYWLLHVNFLDIAFITLMKGTDSMEKYIQRLIQRLIFLVTCCTGGGVIHEI